jgi:hypothetical protein
MAMPAVVADAGPAAAVFTLAERSHPMRLRGRSLALLRLGAKRIASTCDSCWLSRYSTA